VFCPICRDEFRAGFTICNDCGVALVEELPLEDEPEPVEFVDLLTFRNEHEAKLANVRLRAAGIPSSVSKDDAGGMEPHLQLSGTVRLRVPMDRVRDARRLLDIGGE
jgi:hypothetical protein